MAAVTMVKMMVMTTTTTMTMEMTTMTMNMKKMGNQVVGKWVQSSWQMGVLASLNVPPCCCCWTVLQCCWTVLQNCTHCTVFTAVVNLHLLLLLDCAAKNAKVQDTQCTMGNVLQLLQFHPLHSVHYTAKLQLQNCNTIHAAQKLLNFKN